MKKILLCVITVITFYVTCFLIGCGIGKIFFTGCDNFSKNNSAQKQQEIYKQAIQKVLDYDAMTGEIDDSNVNTFYRSTENKVQNMQNIDLSQCPPEFQTAFMDHISAWQQQLSVSSELVDFDDRYNSFDGFCEALLRVFIIDFRMPIEAREKLAKIRDRANKASNNASTTWNKVLQIAIKYGVNVSKYK